jgi:hypothetical protein
MAHALRNSAVPMPLKCVENTRPLCNKLDLSVVHPSLVIKQRSIIKAHMKAEANSAGPRAVPSMGASSLSSAEPSMAFRGVHFTNDAQDLPDSPPAPTHPTNKLCKHEVQVTALGNNLSNTCET